MVVTRRRVLVGSAAMIGTLGVGAGTATAAERGHSPTTTRQRAAFGMPLPGGLVCPVPYLSRSAWGADESWRYKNGAEYWPIEPFVAQTLTVHHTGFAANPDAAETVRTIYRQQALDPARGGIQDWGDIGYHLLIDAEGTVYEGRYSGGDGHPVFSGSLMVTGAHVQGYNTGNLSVCLLGYLNDAPPTAAAQQTLVTVLAYLSSAAGINPVGTVNYANPVNGNTRTVRGVNGHRNWTATDCPGHAFYPLIDSIRQQAAAAMPTPPSPEPSQTQIDPSPTPEPSTPTADPSAPPSDGGSPNPAPTESSVPPQPTPNPPPPAQPPPAGGGGGSERGGDEYVAVARSQSPEQFPTVLPSTSAEASSASASARGSAPAPRTRRSTSAAAAVPQTDGPAWGAAATVVGMTATGALATLGLWWLRQRRAGMAAAPGGAGLTVIDEPTVAPADETPEVRETSEAAPAESTVDNLGAAATAESAQDAQAQDDKAPAAQDAATEEPAQDGQAQDDKTAGDTAPDDAESEGPQSPPRAPDASTGE